MTNCLKIEKLEINHDLKLFDCGNTALNDFLKKYALTNQKMRSSTTYLALEGDKVVGYYSIASASVRYENAPKKVSRGLPQYDIPVLLLARLAVTVNKQGAGLGKGLLKNSMLRAVEVADIVGMRALLVHAKNEKAVNFYKAFDFKDSPFNERHLYLTIKDIQKNLR